MLGPGEPGCCACVDSSDGLVSSIIAALAPAAATCGSTAAARKEIVVMMGFAVWVNGKYSPRAIDDADVSLGGSGSNIGSSIGNLDIRADSKDRGNVLSVRWYKASMKVKSVVLEVETAVSWLLPPFLPLLHTLEMRRYSRRAT